VSPDLRTAYLGLELGNPLVPSASPLGQRIETLRALQDAGAAAVVLPSLFEEQIEHDEIQFTGALEAGAESYAEALTYLPEFADYTTGSDAYLRHLEATVRDLEIPVIGSLNGISLGGWVEHARRIEDAGAAALELNVYFIAADPDETGAAVEQRYVDLVEAVRAHCTIPLAVKIGPFFSSVGDIARRLVDAGADGLVLFNRFMQPDLDLDAMTVDTTLHLSEPDELLLPLRWIAILRGRVDCSIAATTDVLRDLDQWLDEHGYDSVQQMRGAMSQEHVPNPVAFARANYAHLVTSFVSPYDWRMAEPEGELHA